MFDKFSRIVSRWAGSKWAFALAALSIVVWAACGPIFNYSDSWSLAVNTGTTIITFLMVFLIQNSQNRESAANSVKQDEILRALDKAHNTMIGLESKTEEEIEAARVSILEESALGGCPTP